MEKGKIVQILGPVIDVEFETEQLPLIHDALTVVNKGKESCYGSGTAYGKSYCALYPVSSQ